MMIMVSNTLPERVRAAAGKGGAETPHRFRDIQGAMKKIKPPARTTGIIHGIFRRFDV
ncbi:hypothetical protein [Desulfatitalea tepidiphila]|uniref:hypothetical protein n=1 Tax=Desulfatitalea tepidiphila TaxID=1185843 RepID=UPI00137933CB|nr:hypothetical protein [Desulfatitalea tepidiphila]